MVSQVSRMQSSADNSNTPSAESSGCLPITLPSRACARILILLTCSWPILDLALNIFLEVPQPLQRMFNIAREGSLPSLFSAMLLLLAGCGFLLLGFFRKFQSQPYRRFLALGSLFTYMAIDDAAEIHERLSSTFKELMAVTPDSWLSHLPTYFWQIVYGPLYLGMGVLILAICYFDFKRPRLRLLLLGTLTCFVVAVGCDALEGFVRHLPDLVSPVFLRYEVSHGLKVFEEFVEMLGATLAILAAYTNLTGRNFSVALRFAGTARTTTENSLEIPPSAPAVTRLVQV